MDNMEETYYLLNNEKYTHVDSLIKESEIDEYYDYFSATFGYQMLAAQELQDLKEDAEIDDIPCEETIDAILNGYKEEFIDALIELDPIHIEGIDNAYTAQGTVYQINGDDIVRIGELSDFH
jgi:hypothetical protein